MELILSMVMCEIQGVLLLQEADIDEDEEVNLVSDWNNADADAAYRAQVERAELEERERAEAAAAWAEVRGSRMGAQPRVASNCGKGPVSWSTLLVCCTHKRHALLASCSSNKN